MIKYRGEINDLIAKMFAILPRVRDANRASVTAYISRVYELVMAVVGSVNDTAVNDALQSRFKSYIETEESRLKGNLEAVEYDIDQLDTLSLITGPGRIEKVGGLVLFFFLTTSLMRVSVSISCRCSACY